jgi:predicted RNase H-like nuclease (RuvC/YqgF family)
MRQEDPRGQSRPEFADLSSESGWVTTDVAARAVRVSPRTIRRYIDQGRLEAKPQGEGVRREWLVSVDSLHALRATRTFHEASRRTDRVLNADFPADSIADVVREMAARLERRAEEAAELRIRLELTERAQSTLEAELAEANRRREEAERELDELRRQLEAREESPESPGSPTPTESTTDAGGEAQEAAERQEERKGWFRRYFGF